MISSTFNGDGYIIKGALSHDHVHMFVAIPPKLSVSDVVRRIKGRSSHRIQREFAWVKKLYWGQRFWARGYFIPFLENFQL